MSKEICEVSNCSLPVNCNGLCKGHYDKLRYFGNTESGASVGSRMKRLGSCLVIGCEKPIRSLGLCSGHYKKSRGERPTKEARNRAMIKMYGISMDEYDTLLINQEGVCAICHGLCKSGRRLHVDHCHKTGKVRQLLCDRCNRGIGVFNDNISLMVSAVEYLKKWR